MDKKDLERRLEAAEKQNLGLLDEIKNLKAKLAEVHDEPEIPDFPEFKPTAGEAWHINNVLEVSSTPSYYPLSVDDYNYFHTKEMAQEFADKCKLIAMMLHCKWYLCKGFKGDYSDSNDKWVVYYGGGDNKFTATSSIHRDYGSVTFDTIENAQKCADWLNEHWRENDE